MTKITDINTATKLEKHTPTDKTKTYVKNARSMKMTLEKIATHLGISRRTLGHHYPKELEEGKSEIPRLAVHKIRKYLNKTFDDPKDQQAQAQLAEKVMKSHGWSEKLDLGGLTALPGIIVRKIPEDPNDV